MGRHFRKLREAQLWKGIKMAKGIELISHSQFANDTMLFEEATIREAKTIQSTLDLYILEFDQIMNKE